MRILTPSDPAYDEARRIWNGAIDRSPAAIAPCADPADVVEALQFARERELAVTVRGGGHGVGGHAVGDGALMVDLSPMRAIEVDAVSRMARAEAGVLWGELDAQTQTHGLATVGGIVTHTGIAGLTLGGGIGWLMRKHGATVDNLASAELVNAAGDVVKTSEEENAELFWGIRGGGGNFGVVTRFEYRLHPVGPTVLAGPIFHPLDRSVEALRFYREFVAAAPDELTTIFNLRRAPPLPVLPRELHGRPVVIINSCYAGHPDEGASVMQPLKEFGDPLADLLQPRPYLELQSMFDAAVPHGWHYYWKSLELPALSDGAIETLVGHAAAATSPRSYCMVFQLGGALGRVPQEATAFAQRDTAFNVNINAVWTEGDPGADDHVAWTQDYFEAMRPHARDRVYLNFLGDEGQSRVREAYGTATYERLKALKRTCDPANVFRANQNVEPG